MNPSDKIKSRNSSPTLITQIGKDYSNPDNVAVREEKYNKALKSGDKALFDGLAYMNIVTAPAVNEEATAPAVNEVTATAV